MEGGIRHLKIAILNFFMYITDILKTEKGEYAVFTREALKLGKDEVKFNFKQVGNKGQEEYLKPVAEIRGVGPPLSQFPGPMYLSKEKLLEALSKSGVKPEEIEKLKSKL
jgi:hypothetical protein